MTTSICCRMWNQSTFCIIARRLDSCSSTFLCDIHGETLARASAAQNRLFNSWCTRQKRFLSKWRIQNKSRFNANRSRSKAMTSIGLFSARLNCEKILCTPYFERKHRLPRASRSGQAWWLRFYVPVVDVVYIVLQEREASARPKCSFACNAKPQVCVYKLMIKVLWLHLIISVQCSDWHVVCRRDLALNT